MIARVAVQLIACTAGLVVAGCAMSANGSSGTTRLRELHAWASLGEKPPVGVTQAPFSRSAHPSRHLPAGVYRVYVIADEMFGLQLVGPGVNRHTHVLLYERSRWNVTNTTWKIRLRRGLYQYRAIGPYVAGVSHVTGSFRVP